MQGLEVRFGTQVHGGVKVRGIEIKRPVGYGPVWCWVMQKALKWGIRKPIQCGNYMQLLAADRLGEIIVGDLLELGGETLIYIGMNPHGGPGQVLFASMGYPTPQFTFTTPQHPPHATIFPIEAFPGWKKVGHTTPEEFWDKADLAMPGDA